MEKIITYSAQNYANALFEIGANFAEDILTVVDTIKISSDFNNIILNPAIDLALKYSIIDEVFTNKIDAKVLQFVKILVEKNRISELEQIYTSYIEKINEQNGVKFVEITSAIQLDDETKNRIVEKLSQKLNKKISPEWKTDEEIISGLVFKIGDNIVDTSLRTKIENIGKNIR